MSQAEQSNYIFCEVCQGYKSKHNFKRHEKCHALCTVCLKVGGPKKAHNCELVSTVNRIQWIAVTDTATGKTIAYVLGLTAKNFEANNQQVSDDQLQIIMELALEKQDGQ
jgi:hypothetical protein